MAYTIKLGSFSKLENSTAQPNTTGWADYDVTLKEGCDISNPEITLSVSWATVSGYNYAKMMDRYYWITGKNMLRENLCVLSLKVDVLATYKTEIGAATLYVLRSAAASYGYIRDNFYPIMANATVYHQESYSGMQSSFSSGRIVLNVAGTDTTGSSTLYEMSTSQFASIVSILYNHIDGFQPADAIGNLGKLFGGNPQSLINGAMWFPFGFIGTSAHCVIGSYDTLEIVNKITDPLMTATGYQFDLYKHPQAAVRGDYLNVAPYSAYYLTIPGAGTISLDTSRLINETKVEIIPQVDAISGECRMEVFAYTSRQLLAYVSCQYGVPIMLRGANNASDMITRGIQTIGGAIGGLLSGDVGLIAGAAQSGIGIATEAIGGTGVSTGMGGGLLNTYAQVVTLDSVFYPVVDEDNTEHGRPLCENRQISTLSGYNIVSEGNVAVPGPLPEQQEVKRILESGFFYE